MGLRIAVIGGGSSVFDWFRNPSAEASGERFARFLNSHFAGVGIDDKAKGFLFSQPRKAERFLRDEPNCMPRIVVGFSRGAFQADSVAARIGLKDMDLFAAMDAKDIQRHRKGFAFPDGETRALQPSLPALIGKEGVVGFYQRQDTPKYSGLYVISHLSRFNTETTDSAVRHGNFLDNPSVQAAFVQRIRRLYVR